MENRGMTLLEVTVSAALLTLVLGVLFMLAASLGAATRTEESQLTAVDRARDGMRDMIRELRQAGRQSILWDSLPGDTITYGVAVDTDGNGTAVDVDGELELSADRTIGPDVDDANGDGLTTSQLIKIDQATTQVLANGLVASEDMDGNGQLDEGEDANGNGVLDQGIRFEPWGGGLLVTLQTEHRVQPHDPAMSSTFTEMVVPRN
jgi:type II secretory pathway pseudopilin PulG